MFYKSTNFAFIILIYSLKVQAHRPTGYIGCFEDTGNRVLNGKKKDFDPNSGDRCKRFCRKHGYRYAGTESGEECFCGDYIRVKYPADDCDYVCEGNPEELCGGDWRISIYDTWHCATEPCKNGATCMDIDAGNHNCICTDEWTGSHCEHEKPETTVKLPSSTKTTEHYKTSTAATLQSSTTYAKSSEGTSIDARTNVTVSPYIKPADDPSSSPITMYVALPLGVIVILVIIAVIVRRRRQRKKEPVPEIISPETGPVPDVYANLSAQGGTMLKHGNESLNSSRDEAARLGNEVGVSDKEGRVILDQETEEYNTITLRPNNKTLSHNSYNHVQKPRSSVDKTYSNLSAIQLSNNHISASNTYSHTEKSPGHNNVSSTAENTVNTYNILEPRANPHPHRTGDTMEEYSVYDRTDRGFSDRMEGADNYSHMSTVISLQNDNIENRSIGNENIYLNEEEYATVQKAAKK